jgi:hypothetical protein
VTITSSPWACQKSHNSVSVAPADRKPREVGTALMRNRPSAAGRENFESEQCNRVMQNLLEIILRFATLRPLRTAELCSALLRSLLCVSLGARRLFRLMIDFFPALVLHKNLAQKKKKKLVRPLETLSE